MKRTLVQFDENQTKRVHLKFAVSHTIAFRMEGPSTATQTTDPTETDETFELYGNASVVSSPMSCTEQVEPFGEDLTTAFRTRKQSPVCLSISSRTMAAMADRTSFASDNKLIWILRYDGYIVTVKSGRSFTDVQEMDILPVSPMGRVKP